MVRYYKRCNSDSTILWISPLVNSKDGVDFAILFTLRKAGRLQILCCQGFEVNDYNFTLDALALKLLRLLLRVNGFQSNLIYLFLASDSRNFFIRF